MCRICRHTLTVYYLGTTVYSVYCDMCVLVLYWCNGFEGGGGGWVRRCGILHYEHSIQASTFAVRYQLLDLVLERETLKKTQELCWCMMNNAYQQLLGFIFPRKCY